MMNCLDFNDRIIAGQGKEKLIIDKLNHYCPIEFNNLTIQGLYKSELHEDMRQKIDAWATCTDETIPPYVQVGSQSVQIKYRPEGYDLGIALLRPWISLEDFRSEFITDNIHFDRDAITKVDYYAFYCEESKLLGIVDQWAVQRVCVILLESLFLSDGFEDGVFRTERYGAELRLVTDQGQGYTEGQQKVICYIKPALIEQLGGKLWIG